LGLCYLALEPAVRRRWPWGQTAWNRLLAGRFRSPLVGRDVLAGLVFGVVAAPLAPAVRLCAPAVGVAPPRAAAGGPPPPHGRLPPLTAALLVPAAGVGAALETYLLAFLLSLLFRRPWLYWPAFVAMGTSVGVAIVPQATAGALAMSIIWGVIY